MLWVLLVATYFIYAPALDAPWQFDSGPNLRGLADVRDPATALDFITGGMASTLGRPLALAAFLPNVADWPGEPAAFRHINVLIHLLNGLLIAWLGLRVARLQPNLTTHPVWPALTLAALWLMHPLLASTSLFVVQRMALLAATFTLLGLLAFVRGRGLLAERPGAGYAWMSGGLTLGAVLGVFAKENAALLPFFAAALNATILGHLPSGNRRLWRAWQLAFFAGPALLLILYIASHWSSLLQGYAGRPFSLEERVLTQPVILWDYIRQLLMPNIAQMGPFHDDATIQRGLTLSSALSILGWAISVAAAVLLRRRAPWLALAVFWFLAGHLLESTVFNLELYYEHRNYVPSLGPLAALIALAWASRRLWARVAVTAALPVTALLLWQVTTLWGHPRLAAERWASAHPASSRATQFLSQRYALAGDHDTALRVIQRGHEANPKASDLAVQTLQLSCGLAGEDELREILDELIAEAPTLDPSLATPKATNTLKLQLRDQRCPGLDENGLIRLISALLENPTIQSYGLMRHHLRHQLAEIHTARGNLDGAVRNLQAAFAARPNPQTAQLLAVTLASAGLYREALASLDKALSHAPTFGPRRHKWKAVIAPLQTMLEQQLAANQPPATSR